MYDMFVLQLIDNAKWCQEVGRYKILQRESLQQQAPRNSLAAKLRLLIKCRIIRKPLMCKDVFCRLQKLLQISC